jgi:hypothetical protein
MPHSPGIYVALVLKQVSEILAEEPLEPLLKAKEGSVKSDSTNVQRNVIRNNLFIDI